MYPTFQHSAIARGLFEGKDEAVHSFKQSVKYSALCFRSFSVVFEVPAQFLCRWQRENRKFKFKSRFKTASRIEKSRFKRCIEKDGQMV